MGKPYFISSVWARVGRVVVVLGLGLGFEEVVRRRKRERRVQMRSLAMAAVLFAKLVKMQVAG